MIVLDATTKSLEIILAGAVTTNQLPATVSFVDILTADQSVSTISDNNTISNNTTAVTLVSAPASGHIRVIKSFFITNTDTVAVTITVRINVSGTFYTICKVTLAVGDNLQYSADD